MAIQHTIVATDSLPHIAQTYFNDSSKWREIVTYNKLSPPYIVETQEEKVNLLYAKGFVTIVRANYQSEATVKQGWTFATKPSLVDGQIKEFVITENVYIEAGVQTALIPVIARVPGYYGNVNEAIIEVPGVEFVQNNVALQSCTNPWRLTGGRDIHVLVVGEILYIPVDDVALPPRDTDRLFDLIGGEDIAIDKDGEPSVDGFGDIASVSGIANIVQAINARLQTERGELPHHPEYGTNIPTLLGSAQSPYTRKLVELEIYDALSYEDRIGDVEIQHLLIAGTTITATVTFKLADTDQVFSTEFLMNYNQAS